MGSRPLRTLLARLLPLTVFAALAVTTTPAADRITYEDYLAMDEETVQKAARRHVKQKDGYFVLSRGKYVIHTDVSPTYALKMTVLMDDFHNRFSSVFNGSFKRKDNPRVFILKDRDGYQRALSEVTRGRIHAGWSAGMYIPSKRALFANGGYGEDALIKILFHEGTHQLNHAFMDTRLPVWFDEGLATNFESWELTRDHRNNLSNSIYASWRLGSLVAIYPDKGFVPFTRLVEIDHRDWQASTNPGANYASAWVTTFFFLSCEDGRTLMNKLVRHFRRGGDADDLLGREINQRIEQRLGEFIENRILPSIRFGRGVMKHIYQRNFPAAYEHAKKMLEKHPDNPEAKLFVHWLSVTQENLEGDALTKAIAVLEALDEDNDFDHPELAFALAQSHAKAGNLLVALEHARKAVKGNAKHPFAPKLLKRLEAAAPEEDEEE